MASALKFIYFGSSQFSKDILKGLYLKGFEPYLVVSKPDKPKGRHLRLEPTEVSSFAHNSKIPLIRPKSLKDKAVKQNLKEARGIINHIALGSDIFIKFWKKENKYVLKPTIEDCNNDFYNIYKIGNLSFSYFISNLLEFTCSSQIDDRLWLLYPIEGTKESYRISTVCLE